MRTRRLPVKRTDAVYSNPSDPLDPPDLLTRFDPRDLLDLLDPPHLWNAILGNPR